MSALSRRPNDEREASLPLTPAQREALRLGRSKGGVHVGAGRDAPDKHVTKPVARRLVDAGLASWHGSTLLTLEAGRKALAAPQPHEAVFLRLRDGLTTQRALSVRDEPEVQDVGELAARWRDGAAERLAESESPRDRARRLARATRRAA